MEAWEYRKLAGTGNRKLVLYALERWEEECSHNPEPVIIALGSSDSEILRRAISLAVRFHPSSSVSSILALFSRSDPLHRRLAVEAIVPSMGAVAEMRLKELLSVEQHPFVLASAVIALARLNMSIELLKPFLSHPDMRVRANTVVALGKLSNPETCELLKPFLEDPSPRIQNEAIRALSRYVSEFECESFILKRMSSPDEVIRASITFLTGELQISRKISLLIGMLKDPSESVVACALRALEKNADPMGLRAVVELFFNTNFKSLFPMIFSCLKKADPGRIVSQAERYGSPAEVSETTAKRILDFAKVSPSWEIFLPWIMTCLQRQEKELRYLALEIVIEKASFFAPGLDDLLGKQERSGDPQEKAMAARIRWRSGQITGLETLQGMLRDSNPEIRKAAVEALQADPTQLAKKTLEDAARDGIQEARAIIISGQLPDPIQIKLP